MDHSVIVLAVDEIVDGLDLDLSESDRRVFVAFGRAMLSAQVLEFTIFQLAQLEKKTPGDLKRALARIDGLLKQPKRDQGRNLGGLDPGLREDIELALRIRNRLAHDALLEYRVEAAVAGTEASAVELVLINALGFFDDVQARLDQVADDRLEKKGMRAPYLEDEEMNELMERLGEWVRGLRSSES